MTGKLRPGNMRQAVAGGAFGLFDFLAYCSVPLVAWIVESRWGLLPAIVAGAVCGVVAVVVVGTVQALVSRNFQSKGLNHDT